MAKYPFEPFRVKVVEPIRMSTREQRAARIAEAGHNVFGLRAEDVLIDLLTDSGTTAMSDDQWAGMMVGDESYAGCRNYYHLREAVEEIFGMPFFVPTHQGRGAETILCDLFVQPGKPIPNNTHFDSTEANVLVRGGVALNLPVPEARDPASHHPFKGDMDVAGLRAAIQSWGPENVPLILLTVTNNTAAGQPVSMRNLRETRAVADEFGIPLFFDAARYAENAYFIKLREAGYAEKSPLEIAQEMFSYADGFVMSSKKDGLVNIGGLFGMRDEALYGKVTVEMILREGFLTYGGMAGRDLEALARGLREGLQESYLAHRIGQTRYFGEKLVDAGVPIFEPPGGHAVYVDARRFFPHIPQSEFPGVALTSHLYVDAGVRGIELGSLAFAHTDPETGETRCPELETVRLALPRRVYSQTHIDYVVESLAELYARRESVRGMRVVWEGPYMRHFTARLEPIG
ncbi:MAG: tryptophanase [Thermoleophilia bacterium]|nr:tryptophanase [Thermoleophilia bacterium]